jgi:hypothetical protein
MSTVKATTACRKQGRQRGRITLLDNIGLASYLKPAQASLVREGRL